MGTCVNCGTELADELVCPTCRTVQDMEKMAKIIETKKMKHTGKAVASIVLAALSLVVVCFLLALLHTTSIMHAVFSAKLVIMTAAPFLSGLVLVAQTLGIISIYGHRNSLGLVGTCLSALAFCSLCMVLIRTFFF